MKISSFIVSILLFCTLQVNLHGTEGIKTINAYFYNTPYEGFAGYCAVITPELKKVSDTLINKLKINQTNPKGTFTSVYTTDTNKSEQTSPKQTKTAQYFTDSVNKTEIIAPTVAQNTDETTNFNSLLALITEND